MINDSAVDPPMIMRVSMGNDNVVASSTNLQKAVCWIGEIMQEHPEKERKQVLKDAQMRFDLTPVECEFVTKNFAKVAAGKSC